MYSTGCFQSCLVRCSLALLPLGLKSKCYLTHWLGSGYLNERLRFFALER